jgi:hypothetical protein
MLSHSRRRIGLGWRRRFSRRTQEPGGRTGSPAIHSHKWDSNVPSKTAYPDRYVEIHDFGAAGLARPSGVKRAMEVDIFEVNHPRRTALGSGLRSYSRRRGTTSNPTL